MTEAEWLVALNPIPLLASVRDVASDRKFRLFACACCRRVWELLGDVRSRRAVEAAEAFIDGTLSTGSLRAANEEAGRVCANRSPPGSCFPNEAQMPRSHWEMAQAAAIAAMHFNTPNDRLLCAGVAVQQTEAAVECRVEDEKPLPGMRPFLIRVEKEREGSAQVHLVRDIFGNPFRPVTFSSEWRTATVVSLAQGMYESRDFGAMPILADALQDAGCDSADMLDHCRGPGPHVRGCWVVDLVLGKE